MSLELLKTVPYFRGLSPPELEAVAQKTQEIRLDRGQVVFLEGDQSPGLYFVTSGRVRIFKTSREGREQVLRIAQSGETFNDIPVLDGGLNPASASAMERSTVYLVPTSQLFSLFSDCPAASAAIQVLAGRVRHLTSMVENLAFKSVVSRLAKLLSEMAIAGDSSAPVPRLTQDDMAAMVGSVRDVVGRGLKYLEKRGAIKLEGHRILVLSLERLRDIA